ncbi:hypothetical protein NGE73_22125 [Bacillus cereus]|uniref:Uncharacterized protein n=2 Tax=Bacillaceae TaxID=186817 RepID=A0A0J1KL10_BACAN|nr:MULTISPECIES: hypothetical protein [Bacillus cereus group]MRB24437.1 hypothetical protein [Bacillus thuringiensis]KLV17330.1 hypothetical protein ABW01_17175 [Bacillus anthracis]MCU4797658.1 hypothetical protein [Bacillus cereus]MCU5532887.1 hypothetical protein [Bacillus cereus]MDA1614708.1 hypothetical protein [Bacillus cereus]
MNIPAIERLLKNEGFDNVRYTEKEGFVFDLNAEVHTGWVNLEYDKQQNQFVIRGTEFKTTELACLMDVAIEMNSFTRCMYHANSWLW